MKPMFEEFAVTLRFTDQLRGGIPKSPDTIEGWLRARVNDEHRVDVLAAATKEEMGVTALDAEQIEALKKSVWNGFKSDENGLYYEGRCCKAALKESANIIRTLTGITALKAKVSERFFVVEDRIYLGRMTSDGDEENFVHAMTPQGPISALKRCDYVKGVEITFTVRCLNQPFELAKKGSDGEKGKVSNEEVLSLILQYASNIGMGSDRSQGHGKFEVVSITRKE